MTASVEKANHGADTLEELYKLVSAHSRVLADQGALMDKVLEEFGRLTTLHDRLVQQLVGQGVLKQEAEMLTPGGIALPKGTDPKELQEILSKVGR